MLELTWNQNPTVQLQKFCVLLSYPLVSLSAHHGDGHLVSLEQHEQLVCVAHTIIGPANPGKRSVFPEPVKPEAQSKEFEKKLKRRKSEAIVEREGSLVGVVVKVNRCLGIS